MGTDETWRLRVADASGRIRGAGVLLPGDRVLTCAHVVASDGGRPREPVPVQFTAIRSPAGAVWGSARVLDDGWHPESAHGRGDLAVLRLEQPPPERAVSAELGRCGPARQRDVRAFGYPAGRVDGIWTEARLVGSGGPGAEWMQLDGFRTGRPIERGFSGAGVIDTATDAVIGILVAVDVDKTARVGWMLPTEVVAEYWPPLAGILDHHRPMSSRGGQISHEQLFHLANCLLEVSAIADDQSRHQVVANLRREISTAIPRNPRARLDVVSIVRTCLNYPGGLANLLAVLRGFEGDSTPLREVERAVAQLRDSVP